MTELERRALLGDRQAQEECTKRGIVLACPLCKCVGTLHSVNNFGSIYAVCQSCGTMTRGYKDASEAIKRWNTRPAPPIGRCKECKHWGGIDEYGDGFCNNPDGIDNIAKETDYCSGFKPKED